MSAAAILHWASISHSGSRKPRNDDSLIAFASSPVGAEILAEKGSLSLASHDLVFAVSDGMGGGNAGDIASSLILQQMTEIIPQTFKAAAAGFFPDWFLQKWSIAIAPLFWPDLRSHLGN